MISFAIFTLSGVVIVTLTVAKRVEDRHKKSLFVLKAISMGDERARRIHHAALHQYSLGKDKFAFWLKKQLPLKLKSFWNRFQAYAKERGAEYFGDVRGSRLLKKSDGISEFFKNISEIEKGGGEINEDFYINTMEETSVTVLTPRIESVAVRAEELVIASKKTAHPVKVKKPRTRQKRAAAPQKKRIPVVEILD